MSYTTQGCPNIDTTNAARDMINLFSQFFDKLTEAESLERCFPVTFTNSSCGTCMIECIAGGVR
jgi:hypothetical protein